MADNPFTAVLLPLLIPQPMLTAGTPKQGQGHSLF